VDYRWHGEGKGIGRFLFEPSSSRVFAVERSAAKGESVLVEARDVIASFQAHTDPVPWSVFGFEVRLPSDLLLEKFKFLTGRITLNFKGSGIALTAERWGLADSILRKHDIVDWTRALVGSGDVYSTPYSLWVTGPPRFPWGRTTEAIVRHDEENNRLLVLKAVHRNRPPRPEWLP
jgi:hypothetical protein